MTTEIKQDGCLIAIEGMDGSGKTEGSRYFAQCLKDLGVELIQTREVGGTPMGEQIRAMCLDSKHEVDPLARLLAVLAARAQHLAQVIVPNLEKGIHVICDRYSDSTVVYDGAIGGCLPYYVELLQTKALAHLAVRPLLTIFFQVDPEVAFERGSKRQNLDNDLYKRDKAMAFDVAHAYEDYYSHLSAEQKDRLIVIDANKPIIEVHAQLKLMAENVVNSLKLRQNTTA